MQEAFKIEKKGLIFNIQKYSIHDGPGIRTVVFFKGCHLKCVWCSNPESQSCNPEVFYSPLKCIGCGECVKRNIHVSIETSGCAPWDRFWDGVKDADLILYDLKAFDAVLHREITGVGNEEILDNAKKISSLKKVVFRIPVIPGYNNFESSFKGLADFINRCNPGGEVHIIPYHALGKPKYKRLGLEYELSDVVPPSDEELKVFARIFSDRGLDTKIY